MSDEKEAGPEATRAKSPATNSEQTYQERFNAQIMAWREEGCPRDVANGDGSEVARCNARPHRVKMLDADADGIVVMSVDCSENHQDVWQFKVAEAEIKDDMKKQAAAASKAAADAGGIARDPMNAVLKITMNLKTQAINIDSWVPTPGCGIQLAGILMSHFFNEQQEAFKAQASRAAGGLLVPEKKLLDRNGKPIATA